MTKVIKSSIIILVLFFFGNSFAEEEQQVISPALPCNTWEVITHNLVHQYKEVPAADGTGAMTMPDGSIFGGETIVFINQHTGSFTIIFREEKTNFACILGAGEKFSPADPKKYLEILGAVEL